MAYTSVADQIASPVTKPDPNKQKKNLFIKKNQTRFSIDKNPFMHAEHTQQDIEKK